MNWGAAEAALVEWVQSAIGDSTPVLWALAQLQDTTTYPAVVIRRRESSPDGQESETTASAPAAPPPAANQELIKTTQQPFRLTLRVYCFCDAANASGEDNPTALLMRALLALRVQDLSASLIAAGLGLETYGAVIDEIDSETPLSSWQPAAMADVTFSVSESVTRRLGYIAQANAVGTISGQEADFSAPLPTE